MSATAEASRRAPTGVGIIGTGLAVPDQIRTNDWWPEAWRQAHQERLARDVVGSVDRAAHEKARDIDPEVVRHAGPYFQDLFRGTRERRVVGDGERASDLEIRACQQALSDAAVRPDQVDALITSSVVTDYVATRNSGAVAHGLGLRRDVSVTEVDTGCASFLHQLRVAVALVTLGEARTVLVVASSAASRINDYTLPSSVVIGDGAVAAVVSAVGDGFGYIGSVTRTLGELNKGILVVRKSDPEAPWFAPHAEPLTMQRVDGRAAHTAGGKAATLFRETVGELLDQTGYRVDDIAFLGVSQAGAWFGPALAEAIGLPPDRITPPADHFERYGHMMQASAPTNLHVGLQTGRVRDGDLVLLYSPGVGFTTMASLIRWGASPAAR